jgi:hypothetical protein
MTENGSPLNVKPASEKNGKAANNLSFSRDKKRSNVPRVFTQVEYDAFLAEIEGRRDYLNLKLKAEIKIQSGEWVIVDTSHRVASQEMLA